MNAGFFDTNRRIAYPFVRGTVGLPGTGSIATLPNSVIVDCGFTTGPSVPFSVGSDQVYLDSITRTGSVLTFVFKTTALINVSITFTRNVTDQPYVTEFANSGGSGQTAPGESISYPAMSAAYVQCPSPLWEGYLVTGPLTDLLALLPGNGTITRGIDQGVVEPSLIEVHDDTVTLSLNLANNDRTRYQNVLTSQPEATPCSQITWPFPTNIIYTHGRCLQGDLRIFSGYNSDVKQNSATNTITLGARIGAGEGQVCTRPILNRKEVRRADTVFLEEGPGCGDVFTTINGRGGRMIDLIAGQGVSIEPVPDQHKVIVNVTLAGMKVSGSIPG